MQSDVAPKKQDSDTEQNLADADTKEHETDTRAEKNSESIKRLKFEKVSHSECQNLAAALHWLSLIVAR